mgnify:CR=1 FL=1
MQGKRLLIVSIIWLGSFFLAFDRVNISLAAPGIMGDLGFDGMQMGFILSVYYWGYLLGNFSGGLVSDRVHLREEARYLLDLGHDVPGALLVARDNWKVQKEPADARVLLEAAIAAKDDAVRREVVAWLARHRMEDAQLARIVRESNPISG